MTLNRIALGIVVLGIIVSIAATIAAESGSVGPAWYAGWGLMILGGALLLARKIWR